MRFHVKQPDVVERLRSRSPYLHGSSAEHTMEEAADEIERLRAALQRIADDGKNCQDYCRNRARAALEPKP
jgi:hypothetical protein